MEGPIQQQKRVIERLRLDGTDASAAALRLALMTRAIEEMRHQLGALSPTSRDTLRPKPKHSAAAKK